MDWLMARYGLSVRRACYLSQFSRAAWYRPSQAEDQSVLRGRIQEIALSRPRVGYQARVSGAIASACIGCIASRVCNCACGYAGASTSVCTAGRYRRRHGAMSG